MFGINYIFIFGMPAVDLSFKTERSLESYARTWLTGDEICVTYTHNGVEYTPAWA